jgi:guanylate cyclase
MSTSLGMFWERLASLGVDSLAPDERSTGEERRLRLTNQSAVIGAVSCGSFAGVYALAGPQFLAPMLANLGAVVLLIAALFSSKRGAHTLAKVLVLGPTNLVVVVATMLLGGRVGFLYYLFLTAVVAFLLFSEKQWTLRIAFVVLSAAGCVVALVVPSSSTIAAAITPAIATTIDVASALGVIATVVFIVHLFTGDTARAEVSLAREHARSERLLLNILPGAISLRLKESGEAIADGFADVTVLFADLVGFTELSQKLTPAELVAMLNRTFSAFDDLAEHFCVEKIKTIGDCYMVAAGLPERSADHAQVIARMALSMRDTLVRINTEGGYSLRIRIGLHTGPVVAGVIGKRKFIYDLWGDTVNTASRMESSGSPGEIQVTREVFERLSGQFELESRGRIQVKGKGEMETFLLKGELGASASPSPQARVASTSSSAAS